jgi:hypothetical protein
VDKNLSVMLLLPLVKYLIELGTFQDELLSNSIHLPPIWKSRENVFAIWIALAFVFHAAIAFVAWRYKNELKVLKLWLRSMHDMKKGMCKHRRARWMKCYRRQRRLQNKNEGKHHHEDESESESEEEEDWQCPFERGFWRLQMPPPLPFHHRKHKRSCGKLSSSTTETGTSKIEDIATSEPVASVKIIVEQATTTAKKLLPTIMSSPPVVQTSLIDLARMQHWDTLKAQVNRREAKHHDADGLYPLHW